VAGESCGVGVCWGIGGGRGVWFFDNPPPPPPPRPHLLYWQEVKMRGQLKVLVAIPLEKCPVTY
jgi:hypothetical protein